MLGAPAFVACGAGAPDLPEADFARLPAPACVPSPYSVYALRPGAQIPVSGGIASVNAAGYRGTAIGRKVSGLRRIACVGGSMTFGLPLVEAKTYPARLATERAAAGKPCETVNLGCPGHTIQEATSRFVLQWLDLAPDAVVIGDLEASALPLLTTGFAPDSSHFWKIWVAGEWEGSATLGERVVAAWPGTETQRVSALAASSVQPFETSLAFLVDTAAGRNIRCVVLLPDGRGRGGALEAAIGRLRRAARGALGKRSVAFVDEAELGEPATEPALRAERIATGVSRVLDSWGW